MTTTIARSTDAPSNVKPIWQPVLIRLGVAIALMLAIGLLTMHSTAEMPITENLNKLHTGVIGTITNTIYAGLEPPFAVAFTMLLAAAMWWKANLKKALSFGISVALTWLPVVAFKDVFARPRPDSSLLLYPSPVSANDWSFPSGHAAFICALAIAIVLATGKHKASAIAIALAVMACPLIMGLHYPSDVFASALWASIIAPGMWQLTRAYLSDSPRHARSE